MQSDLAQRYPSYPEIPLMQYLEVLRDIGKNIRELDNGNIQQHYAEFECIVQKITLMKVTNLTDIEEQIKNIDFKFPFNNPAVSFVSNEDSIQAIESHIIKLMQSIEPLRSELLRITSFDFGASLKTAYAQLGLMVGKLDSLKRDHEISTEQLETVCQSYPYANLSCDSDEVTYNKKLMRIKASILRISHDVSEYDKQLTELTKSVFEYIQTADQLINEIDLKREHISKTMSLVIDDASAIIHKSHVSINVSLICIFFLGSLLLIVFYTNTFLDVFLFPASFILTGLIVNVLFSRAIKHKTHLHICRLHTSTQALKNAH